MKLLIFLSLLIAAQAQKDFDPCNDLDDIFKVDLRDCTNYWACDNGKGYKFNCPDGYIFDENIQLCTPGEASACPAPFCPEGDTEIYNKRVSGQCQSYLTCLKGFIVQSTCAPNLFFDDVSKECDLEHKADCLNCPMGTSNTFELLPNKKNCRGYFVCFNGSPYSMSCIDGLYFNQNISRCVDETEYECPYEDFQTNVQTTDPSATEGSTTEGSTTEGSTTEGSTTEGSTTEGSTTEGSTTEDSETEPDP